MSPSTSSASGFSRASTRSTRVITLAMVSAAAGPGAGELMVGPAYPELAEKDLVELVVVVLAGVDEDVVDTRRSSSAITRERRMTSGRVPTTVMTFIGPALRSPAVAPRDCSRNACIDSARGYTGSA